MKNIFFIILIAFLFSCKSKEEVDFFQGYYYSKVNSEIFYFQKKKVTIYNIMDSTSISHKISYDTTKIKIDEIDYDYQNFNQDSLTLYNFNQNKTDLIQFQFSEFDNKELNGSDWSLNFTNEKGNSINQFMKIKNQRGFHFFSSNIENLNDTVYLYETPYIGKFFNKFNIYSLYNVILICNYNEKNISFLRFENYKNRKSDKFILDKVMQKKINPMILGKWNKTKEYNKLNSRTNRKFRFHIKETDKNYKRKIDSINQLLDYSKIEFTHNQKFIRFLKDDSIQIIYDINNTPVSKYLFIDNIDFESQNFEIIKLTKDSLTIQISEPNFLYNYVRDKSYWYKPDGADMLP